jgi:peptide/nickel transport system ATP-binding protein/oligopeptide transport system ATP-binding protein
MAQDICARQEPPLLQIGPKHKVACHFAGEYGAMPTEPITLKALGVDAQGTPIPGESASAEDLSKPGYSAEYTNLETHKSTSARLVGDRASDDPKGEGTATAE